MPDLRAGFAPAPAGASTFASPSCARHLCQSGCRRRDTLPASSESGLVGHSWPSRMTSTRTETFRVSSRLVTSGAWRDHARLSSTRLWAANLTRADCGTRGVRRLAPLTLPAWGPRGEGRVRGGPRSPGWRVCYSRGTSFPVSPGLASPPGSGTRAWTPLTANRVARRPPAASWAGPRGSPTERAPSYPLRVPWPPRALRTRRHSPEVSEFLSARRDIRSEAGFRDRAGG